MPRRKVIDKYHKVKSIGGSQTPIQAKPIGGYGDTRSEQECCNDPLAKAVCQFACVPCIAANGQLQPGNDCFEIVDIWQDCPGGSTVYQWSPYGGHQADGTSNIADACLGKLKYKKGTGKFKDHEGTECIYAINFLKHGNGTFQKAKCKYKK